MFKFFRNIAARKKYQQSVDDWVTVLFCGFPLANLSNLKGKIDYSGLIQHGLDHDERPGEIGLAASLILFQKMLLELPESEKLAALNDVEANEWGNPISTGINCFSQITAQMVKNGEIKPATERLYLLQMMGALRGATADEITAAWGAEEITRLRL